jgi:hypothetical protein
MYGCIGRIAVLCLLLLLGLAAYVTRDRWMPQVMTRMSGRRFANASWRPITREGADRTRAAIDTLKRPGGAAFVNVAPADVVSYALGPVLARLLPGEREAAGPAARAEVGLLLVRGSVKIADLGGAAALGPLAGVLEGTQRIEVRGSVEVPDPGHTSWCPASRSVTSCSLKPRSAMSSSRSCPVGIARKPRRRSPSTCPRRSRTFASVPAP